MLSCLSVVRNPVQASSPSKFSYISWASLLPYLDISNQYEVSSMKNSSSYRVMCMIVSEFCLCVSIDKNTGQKHWGATLSLQAICTCEQAVHDLLENAHQPRCMKILFWNFLFTSHYEQLKNLNLQKILLKMLEKVESNLRFLILIYMMQNFEATKWHAFKRNLKRSIFTFIEAFLIRELVYNLVLCSFKRRDLINAKHYKHTYVHNFNGVLTRRFCGMREHWRTSFCFMLNGHKTMRFLSVSSVKLFILKHVFMIIF